MNYIKHIDLSLETSDKEYHYQYKLKEGINYLFHDPDINIEEPYEKIKALFSEGSDCIEIKGDRNLILDNLKWIFVPIYLPQYYTGNEREILERDRLLEINPELLEEIIPAICKDLDRIIVNKARGLSKFTNIHDVGDESILRCRLDPSGMLNILSIYEDYSIVDRFVAHGENTLVTLLLFIHRRRLIRADLPLILSYYSIGFYDHLLFPGVINLLQSLDEQVIILVRDDEMTRERLSQ